MFESLRTMFRKFTPVEERMLAELKKLLPSESADIVDRQIASLNKVQRYLDWTETNFYHLRDGKPAWEEVERCAARDELKVADIDFVIEGQKFRANVNFVDGHLFSLVIRPSIKKYSFSKIMDITQTRLVADPNKQQPDSIAKNKSLPQSFIEWMGQNKDRRVNGWDILDITDVYGVMLADADYRVLAIRNGGEYLLAKSEPSEDIFLADGIHTTRTGRSFAEALIS